MQNIKLIYRRIFFWVASTKVWQFVLTWVIPAIRFGKMSFPFEVYDALVGSIKIGDTLLVRDPQKFSHIIIGGEYSHAGICTEILASGTPIIAEMGHAGFQEVNLLKFLGYSRKIVSIRPINQSAPQKNPSMVGVAQSNYGQAMANWARHIGLSSKGYDFSFAFGEKALYCSELCYLADYEKRYQANLQDLAGLGHEYISPDGLFKAKGALRVFEWNASKRLCFTTRRIVQ